MSRDGNGRVNLLGKIVEYFIKSNATLPLLFMILLLGIAATLLTPQEEEPQIVVPIADIFIEVPGASPEEVEKLVSSPLEQLLWQIDGVEYVYSTALYDRAVVTVRFFVGEDRERSWIKLYNKVQSHVDRVPAIVKGWVIKPVEIDDVPIVTLTLHSGRYDESQLKLMAEELKVRLEEVEDISRTKISSGRSEEVRVEVDGEKLSGYGLTLTDLTALLRAADVQLALGDFQQRNRQYELRSSPTLESVEQVENLVISARGGKPVYLRDVAKVALLPEEPSSYSRISRVEGGERTVENAVTIELAKKKGTNAVVVAQNIIDKLHHLQKTILPSDVDVTVTRNYGETANRKIHELFSSLAFAVVTVVAILMVSLGWREGLIVALAVPTSFSLTLLSNYLFGYTLNRVTLFALILTLGLVVDDPITNVDNIQRHLLKGKKAPLRAAVDAVQEVFVPVVVSTLTIIVSFLPLFFITGMMGPYMAPMAINVPLAVTFSTCIAITIVPWASYRLLKDRGKGVPSDVSTSGTSDEEAGMHGEGSFLPFIVKNISTKMDDLGKRVEHFYGKMLRLCIDHRAVRRVLAATVALLLLLSFLLVVTKLVPLKMLPFDNKNELQLVIDMPKGSTLEATDSVVRAFERYLQSVPEIINYTSYVGVSSPVDFNGLVRHYYLRSAPEKGDIRINLLAKEMREMQSHEIALRIRDDLERIAKQNGVTLSIVESPPGPPVLSTVVAEIYGPPHASYQELIAGADIVKEAMRREKGVVDIDDSSEDESTLCAFAIDREKAALHNVQANTLFNTVAIALSGEKPAYIHSPKARSPLPIVLQLPKRKRSDEKELENLLLRGGGEKLIPLKELGLFEEKRVEQPIYHKNLKRVVYVTAEMAGEPPANAILALKSHFAKNPLPHDLTIDWAGEGEWFITLTVFRDLGVAFFAALVAIYFILMVQTSSFFMPLILMSSIPLTAIGIIPGFFLLNLFSSSDIGNYANPTFFTATAMIGMIALGGIVVRNSSVLITFIEQNIERGLSIKEAILLSGETRLRPIILTALTTAIGVWPITFDPIFSGLGWALIFGLFISTTFSLIIVPSIYWSFYGD